MADVRARFELHMPEYLLHKQIYVLGCGAIGGWATLLLHKLGFNNFILHDYDYVEAENVGVQCYGAMDIKTRKVDALRDMLLLNAGMNRSVRAIVDSAKFGVRRREYVRTADVFIASVDNIETRELFWKRVNAGMLTRRVSSIYIDPRMGVDSYEVHAQFVGNHDLRLLRDWKREYENTFHRNVAPAPCGLEASPITALACASAVVNTVRTMLMRQEFPMFMHHNMQTNTVYKGSMIDAGGAKLPKRANLIARRRKRA